MGRPTREGLVVHDEVESDVARLLQKWRVSAYLVSLPHDTPGLTAKHTASGLLLCISSRITKHELP